MTEGSAALHERVTRLPTVKYAFAGLLVSLLGIAVGHLYVLRGMTDLVLGLPLWVWLQLLVVAVMLALAWIAVQLVAAANARAS